MAGVPAWGPDGLIPPVDGENPVSPDRSPYKIRPSDLVLRFGTNQTRRQILRGLFAYRQALRDAGVTRGFQWLNGSFMEDVERIRGRDPRDMDLVTFFHLPDGVSQAQFMNNNGHLFDRATLQQQYKMDAYPSVLSSEAETLVRASAYWSGVWGHQRESMVWKGFVELSLDADDDEALALLTAHEHEEAEEVAQHD